MASWTERSCHTIARWCPKISSSAWIVSIVISLAAYRKTVWHRRWTVEHRLIIVERIGLIRRIGWKQREAIEIRDASIKYFLTIIVIIERVWLIGVWPVGVPRLIDGVEGNSTFWIGNITLHAIVSTCSKCVTAGCENIGPYATTSTTRSTLDL